MKATAITVTHRKEKDVDIYTATRGPYELEIVNVGGMELASTYENTDKGKITCYLPYRAEIYEPLRQAIKEFKKSNDQCTPTL
jgi:hypothetical protein